MGAETVYRCDKCGVVRSSEQQRFEITVNAFGPYGRKESLHGGEQFYACSAACAFELLADKDRWSEALTGSKAKEKANEAKPALETRSLHVGRQPLESMRPSACVVLIRSGKIAAIRSRKHNGQLELPGGKADPGETPSENASRECFEEIGVRPTFGTLLLRDECGGFDCSCFLVTSKQELVSSSEGEAVWVTPEELLTGTYTSHTAKWLPMVVKELAAR